MRYKILLVLILFAASILRFYGIKEKGLVQYDEGTYLQGAKTITITLDWAIKKLFHIEQPPLKDILYAKDARDYSYTAKPGFYYLIALSSFFVGIYDYAGIIVSGISGVLTTLLIFLIGKELWSPSFGLLSCFIYSVLNYSISYSRSALPVSSAILFMTLGYLFWLYSIRKHPRRNIYLIISGFSIGYGFTCHYSYFFIPLIFLFLEIIYLVKSRFKLKSFFIFGFSMSIPLLIFQMVSELTKFIIYSRGLEKYVFPFSTYFEQLLSQVGFGKASSLSEILSLFLKRVIRRLTGYHIKFEDTFSQPMGPTGVPPGIEESGPLFYINLLVSHDGWIYIFLLAIGIIIFLFNIKRLSFKELSAFLLFFIPVFFWTILCPVKYARVFFITSPFLVLIISFGLMKLFGKKRLLLSFAIILIIINAIFHIPKTIKMKSGRKSAIEWMKLHKGVKHLTTSPPISTFYGGSENVKSFPLDSIDEIKKAYNEGFHYLLLDRNKYYLSENIFIKASYMIKPVALIPHSNDCSVYEETFPQTIVKKILKEPKVLEIYDLGEILYEMTKMGAQ